MIFGLFGKKKTETPHEKCILCDSPIVDEDYADVTLEGEDGTLGEYVYAKMCGRCADLLESQAELAEIEAALEDAVPELKDGKEG